MSKFLKERAILKKGIRQFFDTRGYLEVETPIAVITPGAEEYLRYFATQWWDSKDQATNLWLRSSPELHMKQLLAENHKKIYQIAPCFRNRGERADWHHPEFSMLEWYEQDLDFNPFIEQTGDFLKFTHQWLQSCRVDVNLKIPDKIPKFSVAELFSHLGIDLIDLDPDLPKKAELAGVKSITKIDTFVSSYFKVFLEKIEPLLAKETIAAVYDYPASQAALAQVHNGLAKRVEFYVQGIELSNGFKECLDFQENLKRFNNINLVRSHERFEIPEIDPNFLEALKDDIPPSCGNALGIDRWLALLLGHTSLDQVIPFRKSQIYREN
jgi:lysyl-tRNA synthetase class 2